MPEKITRHFVFIVLLVLVFTSCKTARVITDSKIKSISTSKIISNVENNTLDYKNLTIKRINCQYDDGDEKTTFRANVKAIKNEAILVSFNKLNIPFGRILLTPDSVKFINHIDKTYFLGDYRFLKELFNVDLNFSDVQSILENKVFSYRNMAGGKEFRNFSSYIDSGMYVLQSANNRKLDEKAGILQTFWVAPGSFNVSKIKLEDKPNNQLVEFKFNDYSRFGRSDYPGEIDLNFSSIQSNIKMRIRMAGFSTEKLDGLSFNIPQKYERVILRRN